MHARSRCSKLRKSRKAQDVDSQEVATRTELISDNDLRLSPLDGKEASAEWTIQRSQSALPCRSPSGGVLLTEITVQRATYVINGEDDDTRSA